MGKEAENANPYGADIPLIPAETRGKGTSEADVVKSLMDRLGSKGDRKAPREEPEEDHQDTDEDEEDLDDAGSEDEESDEDESENDESEDDDADEDESEDEEEQDDSEEVEPTTVEVTLPGGKKERVTLEELTKGYSRTADYTRKTQALSTKEQEVEKVQGELKARQEQYVAGLERLEGLLKELHGPEPDWDKLRAEDPDEFTRQWADWSLKSKDRDAVAARKREEQEKLDKLEEEKARKRRDSEVEKLREKWPEFTDEKKGPAVFKQIHDYLSENYGVTSEELMSFADHRFFLLVRDAMFGHEARTKGSNKLKGKLKDAPKSLPPAGRKPASKAAPNRQKMKEADRLKQRLRRSGRSEDAEARVLMRLGAED